MNASVIFACSAGEKALENDDWKHGAMTKCLLDLIPEVSEIDSDIAAITGKLRVSVRNLVSKATDGRMTQTVHPITNGVVKLQLKSTEQTASFLSNSAEMERNKSKSNQNTTSTEFWNAKLHPSIEKKLLGSKVWKNADSAADVFQAESGEWISIAVGKHLADANYPRDACSMHAMAKYAEQLSGLTIDAKQKLHNAELTKIIETHAAAHVMPLPPLAEWESEDGKHISVLYGKVLSK